MRRLQPAISPALLEPLGKVLANFNLLENTAAQFIWVLLSTDQRAGQITTAGMTLPELNDRLRHLYQHREKDPEKLVMMDKLHDQLLKLNTRRNRLVHAMWVAGDTADEGVAVLSGVRRKDLFAFESFSAEDIEKVSDRAIDLASELFDVMLRDRVKPIPVEVGPGGVLTLPPPNKK